MFLQDLNVQVNLNKLIDQGVFVPVKYLIKVVAFYKKNGDGAHGNVVTFYDIIT